MPGGHSAVLISIAMTPIWLAENLALVVPLDTEESEVWFINFMSPLLLLSHPPPPY